MDPLSVLRDFACRSELDRVVQSGDELRFGSAYAFPCSAETAYRSKQGHRYTLETLLFFVRHHHLRHTEYLQAARPFKIPTVTLPDRKPLLDYLLGRTTSADQIDPFPPASADLSADLSAAVEEYRPDDPSFLPSATAAGENDPSLLPPPYPDDAPSAGDGGSIAGARVPLDLDYVAMIRSLERPLKDREALLESKNRDFYGVLVASTKREEERQRIESQQRKDGLVAKTRLIGTDDHHRGGGGGDDHAGSAAAVPKPKLQLLKGSKIGEGVPIILVPSASQTLITIYNVKEFLEDGVFVPSEAKARTMRGARPECVTVQKKLSRDRVVAAYEVRDKPSAFKAEDWERVVAVFVLGKEWQFKDWPFKDHVEIFNKIIGFFVRFEDDSVESAKMVKQWNVKIISISKNKRHQDRAAALEVWDRLEEFMRSRSHT